MVIPLPRIRNASLPITNTADPADPALIEASFSTSTPSVPFNWSGQILRPLMKTSPVICLMRQAEYNCSEETGLYPSLLRKKEISGPHACSTDLFFK